MMKLKKIVEIVFLVGCQGIIPVVAQEKLPLLTGEIPPYHYMEGGEQLGSGTEMVSLVVTRMGYFPEIGMYPLKRGLKMIIDREVSLVYAITPTKERTALLYYSVPIMTVMDVFVKHKKNDFTWETIDDLGKYTIGITEGYNYGSLFNEARREDKLKLDSVTMGGNAELKQLRKVNSGRVDLCLIDINSFIFFKRKYAPEFDNLVFINKPLEEEKSCHVGVVKTYPGAKKLFKEFNAELVKFIAEGKRKEIHNKFDIITSIDENFRNGEIKDQYTDWEIKDNTFDCPFIHYTVTCGNGEIRLIDFHIYKRRYTLTDGRFFSHFNIAADHACQEN